jgi:hypothetical protein
MDGVEFFAPLPLIADIEGGALHLVAVLQLYFCFHGYELPPGRPDGILGHNFAVVGLVLVVTVFPGVADNGVDSERLILFVNYLPLRVPEQHLLLIVLGV